MKKDDILDAMSGIKDEYINEAVPGAARRKSSVWAKAGVIAACLCLFAAVGFLIPYGMNKPAVKPPVNTDIVGSGVETTSPATNETTGMVEDSVDTGDVQNTPGIGGTALCKVHHDMYHSIYGGLSDYVGSKKYSEWVKTLKVDETKINSDTECPIEGNIKLFIDTFNISKTEFAENCNLIQCSEYDLNVLYSKTAEEIDLYYRDIGQFKNVNLSSAHYQYFKDEIAEKYTDVLKEKDIGVGELNMMSIPELVFELNIERDELEALMGDASKTCAELFGANYTYDYNLDMLYDGENLEDLSTNHINEMFCRVGRYADNDFDFIENPDDTNVEDNTPAIGGTEFCTVHHAAYHMIPGWLIEYVGKDKFEEWQNSLTVDGSNVPSDGCNRAASIKTVIDYFNIPEDIFSEYCTYPIDCVYNLKVLYHGTEEEIDLYYRDTEFFRHASDRSGHYDKFLEIIWFDYEKEIAKLGLNQSLYNIFTLSPPEVVQRLNITRDELEEIFKRAADNRISVHGVCYTYEYNLEMIYGEDGVSFEPLEKLLSVNEDDDPTNDISSNELREMFCRVGRYAE